MNTQREVFNKLFKEEKTELATQKIELALVDDIKQIKNKVDKMIGFVRQDLKEIQSAINAAKRTKIGLDKTDNLAKELLKLVKDFENKADDLGIDIPNYVQSAGSGAIILMKENNELKQLVKKF